VARQQRRDSRSLRSDVAVSVGAMSGDSPCVDCGNGVRRETAALRCRICRTGSRIALITSAPRRGSEPYALMRPGPTALKSMSTVVYAHPICLRDPRIQRRNPRRARARRFRGRVYRSTRRTAGRRRDNRAARNRQRNEGRIGMYGFSPGERSFEPAPTARSLVCIAPGYEQIRYTRRFYKTTGALRMASRPCVEHSVLNGRRPKQALCGTKSDKNWNKPGRTTGTTRCTPVAIPSGAAEMKSFRNTSSIALESPDPGAYWSSMDVSRSIDRIPFPAPTIGLV